MMNHGSALRCTPALLSSFLALVLSIPLSGRGQQWTPPTPEELAMTAQPEVPGAPAVYLNREETTDDHLHMFSIYVRLKVLTERGKNFANVELPYTTVSGGGGYTVDAIRGRTVHADGTEIPFTGKPMQKMVEKSGDFKYMAKVFTLPDVQVGSIIEYRYQLRNDDNYYRAPDWYIQSDLYTRKAHYLWKPTGKTLVTNDDRGQLTNGIAWTSILPLGTAIQETTLPAAGVLHDAQEMIALDVHDIPPAPEEEMMPPLKSFTYRVLFYYAPYRSQDEYWKNEGKHWAKLQDKFIGPGPAVKAAVQELTGSGDTQEQKLRKLYAAVMKLENTSFTRQRSGAEEKANGLSQVKTTDDVLERKRGNNDQINALFVAMARAAGMKAYVIAVTNRDRSLFSPSYLSLRQLDDDLAIVTVDGKEQFFDPGSRYTPYGRLAWKHTYANGIRQTDGGGSALASAPGEPYTASKVQRVANLKMDTEGVVTGTVKLTYTGNPALRWRQEALTGDETGLKRDLKTAGQEMLPGGMEVEVASVEKLTEYEDPLTVVLNVKGAIGSPTGRRLLVPASLFEVNTRPLFSHEKRELPVYFHYPEVVQDAVRINFPASFSVESLPSGAKEKLTQAAAYAMTTEKTPTSVTVRRDYVLGQFGFSKTEYPDLRTFYAKMESKDQEPIVLTRADGGGTARPSGQ